jgi:hypothetical protein
MVGFREYNERHALPRTAEFLIAKHLLTSGRRVFEFVLCSSTGSTQDRQCNCPLGDRVGLCREAAIQNSPGF